jgi:hypothetical protein
LYLLAANADTQYLNVRGRAIEIMQPDSEPRVSFEANYPLIDAQRIFAIFDVLYF